MVSSRQKNRMLCLRYNASELEELSARASEVGLTRSAYVRRKIDSKPVTSPQVPKVNWRVYKELSQMNRSLSAIGNNINQIARAMNAARWEGETLPDNLPNPEELEEALKALKQTRAMLRKFRLEISGGKRVK